MEMLPELFGWHKYALHPEGFIGRSIVKMTQLYQMYVVHCC